MDSEKLGMILEQSRSLLRSTIDEIYAQGTTNDYDLWALAILHLELREVHKANEYAELLTSSTDKEMSSAGESLNRLIKLWYGFVLDYELMPGQTGVYRKKKGHTT